MHELEDEQHVEEPKQHVDEPNALRRR